MLGALAGAHAAGAASHASLTVTTVAGGGATVTYSPRPGVTLVAEATGHTSCRDLCRGRWDGERLVLGVHPFVGIHGALSTPIRARTDHCTATVAAALVPGTSSLVVTCEGGGVLTVAVLAMPAAAQPALSLAPPIHLALACPGTTASVQGSRLVLEALPSAPGGPGLATYQWSSSSPSPGLLLAGPRGAPFNSPSFCAPARST